MKNKFLVALLTGVMQSTFAALPTGATLFDVNSPSLYGGWVVGLTALHWETSLFEYDYALTFPPDDSGYPLHEEGVYHSLDPDSRWNFRINLGYIFPCTGNELSFSYLNYHQYTTDHVTLDPFTAIIHPSLSNEWPASAVITINNPSFTEAILVSVSADPNLVTAKTTIKLNVFNLDYGQSINAGSQTRIKYYGGLRYADLSNRTNVIYNFSEISPDNKFIVNNTGAAITLRTNTDFTETVDQHSNFRGLGPQLGVEATYVLSWGFGLIGSLSSSMLVAETDSHLNEKFDHYLSATIVDSDINDIAVGTVFSTTTTDEAGFRFPNRSRIVPNLDAKVGIDYTFQYANPSHSKFSVELGYMISHYFNSIDRLSVVGVGAAAHPILHTVDAHFDGIYFSVQVKI